jgi:hypothetical protein
MAQHGYLHDEYDQGWDRGDDGERSERELRSTSGRDRDWHYRDRDRDFMFGSRDRDRFDDRDHDRGLFSRMGDEASSWSRDEGDRGSDRGMSGYGRERCFGGSNEWREERSRFSSHPDDHYRSWRDRQLQSLDRDYEDYCREREQQFHQDFDSWRQNRQQQGSMGQQKQGGSSEQVMELNNPAAESGETQGAGTSATGAATLGTNNSENSTTGRGRR